MGYEYVKRPLRVVNSTSIIPSVIFSGVLDSSGALVLPTESLTGSGALQTLSTEVCSFLTQGTSGSGRDFRLPAPRAGLFKFIAVNPNTTSPNDLAIQCNTTAHTFFGSSFNTATVADSTVRSRYRTLMLVGVSTTQWAVLSGSTTFWTFTASTGSTGQ